MSENIVNGNYIPTFPPERGFYEGLWKYANPSGNELSGAAAVPFFQKSDVDTGILRQIWGLSTTGPTMNKEQFFTALRLITMVQNGDIPLSKEKLVASANAKFPPPKFNGVQLPPPPVTGGPNMGALPPPEAYAVSPEEKTKYDSLFATYDKDKTSFLPQAQAMPIFMKSGLDPQMLNGIWHLADHDKDGKLSANEFAVAFHLILCVSKKRLPVPPGGLPGPLLALVNTPAPQPHAKQSIGDAFGALDDDAGSVGSGSALGSASVHSSSIPPSSSSVGGHSRSSAPPVAAQSSYTSSKSLSGSGFAGGSEKEHNDLADGVMALSDNAKKMHSAQQQSVEVGHATSASLKYLLQRVATEKISLAAALNNAEEEVNEIRQKLQGTVSEINGLSGEVEEIRAALLSAYESKSRLKDDSSQAQAEKERLQTLIAEGRMELSRLHGEQVQTSGLLGQFGERVASARAENARLSAGAASESAETAVLKGELDTLRGVLAKLSQDKSEAGSEVQRLREELEVARRQLDTEKDKTSNHSQELNKAQQENNKLRQEIENTLKELAIQKAMVHSAPSLIQRSDPAPVAAQVSISDDVSVGSATSVPKSNTAASKTSTTSDSGFGESASKSNDAFDSFGEIEVDIPEASSSSAAADDGFGAFGDAPASSGDDGFGAFGDSAPASSGNDGFGDSAPASSADDGFGAFGDAPASSGDDGFGDSAPASSADDGFGAFGDAPASSGDDGFGAFGDAPASSGNDGFGDSAPASSADDGFGAFGDAPASSGDDGFGAFGDAPASSGDDGFGAFGDAPVSSGDDGFGAFGSTNDGFAAFGETPPPGNGDDGFAAFGESSGGADTEGFGAF